jgi:quinolinate synthase
VLAGVHFMAETARLVNPDKLVLSDNVALQYPDLEFVRPCNLCPHRSGSPCRRSAGRSRQ